MKQELKINTFHYFFNELKNNLENADGDYVKMPFNKDGVVVLLEAYELLKEKENEFKTKLQKLTNETLFFSDNGIQREEEKFEINMKNYRHLCSLHGKNKIDSMLMEEMV